MTGHKYMALDGNAAVALGAALCRVQVVAAYPITPQTPIVERLASEISSGKLKARYINAESEHSALCATIGASLTGARAFTATASAGLALMHEVTGVAAGTRLPIVMPVVNRALPSPWSLWCDHSDAMGERDQGWIQLFAQNAQEALDFIIISYRLAEDERVLLPVMPSLDGFFTSHTVQGVKVPDQELVDVFLPPYRRSKPYFDFNEPAAINPLTTPDVFTEAKRGHQVAMENVRKVLPEVFGLFAQHFKRAYSPITPYRIEDAEIILVCMGSMVGTVKHTVDLLRGQGLKVGLLKITAFRPFFKTEVRECLKYAERVAVIDRSAGLGSEGPLSLEVKAALYPDGPAVYSFSAGLGGRDVTPRTIEKIVKYTATHKSTQDPVWADLKGGVLD